MENLGIPVVSCPGNHERKAWIQYLRHFGPITWHRVDFGPFTILSLDSGHGRDQFTPAQFAWFKRELADTAAFVTALDLVISVNAAVVHLAGRRGAQIRKSFRHLLAQAAGAKRQSVVSIRKIVRSARSGDWDSLYSRSPQLLEEPIAKFFEPIESAHAAFGVPLFDSNADRPTLRNWAANKGEDSLAAYLREKNIRGIDGFGTGIAADAPSMADGLR